MEAFATFPRKKGKKEGHLGVRHQLYIYHLI